MHFTQSTLPSGLTLVRVPMPGVKSVTVLALVKVGSRYETAKNSGISHFLEHMVFKGTQNYPTAQDVASAVDAIGAQFNAFTSKEYTGYYVKSASRDIDVALDVVSDMLLTPRLRSEDLEREKGVIIEEINMYEDTPMRHIGDVFERMFFAGSTLGRDIIGTKKTVSAMEVADFEAHLHNWYGLSNVTLMLVGDDTILTKKRIENQVEEYFSKGKVGQRAQAQTHRFPGKMISDKRMSIVYKKTEQAHFIMGFPGIKYSDPDRYALNVLDVVLGGNMSSRLFTEVREKRGLCYSIHSDEEYYHDAGFFGASAGVDPKRVDEAVKVTLDEFSALIDGRKPVTKQELKKAKDYLTGHIILSAESSYSIAQSYGLKMLYAGKITTIDEVLAQVAKITLDDLDRIAQRLIHPQDARFALIGPFKDEEQFVKIIQRNNVTT